MLVAAIGPSFLALTTTMSRTLSFNTDYLFIQRKSNIDLEKTHDKAVKG